MAKFKEAVKAIIENPKVKKVISNSKKVLENKVVTGVAIPVTTATITTSLTAKRIKESERQHKEDLREYRKLAKKIDGLAEQEAETTKKVNFKKKSFSIDGGGYLKPSPRSIVVEGIKRIAETSKYRSVESSDQSLLEAVKRIGNEDCTIDQNPEITTARLSAYQLGDVIVFYGRYLGSVQIYNLSKIFDTYCRTFKNADYSSELADGNCFIELWIAENSIDFLVKQLVTGGFPLNVVL